jgi:pSer/pThr/pTyr-binding forkhead associated (FHA) protein
MKSPPAIIVQIVHIYGPHKGDIQEFSGDAISIGRHPSCQVRFPADLTAVSRKHAEIVREGNRFKILDKNSTNGTYVNGKKISEAFLKDGDVIAFAETGPKVSFLTQMQESRVALEPQTKPPPQRQAPRMAEEPVVAPVPEPETEEVPVGNVRMPLVVQYGPTLRSFKELPIVIGKGSRSDLVLPHPALCDRHVQVFFWQGHYYVKDLTGQRAVRVNQSPIGVQAPLNADDELSLSPQGPTFRFLGEGRLMELEHPDREGERPDPEKDRQAKQEGTPGTSESKPSPSLFKRFFQ